MTNSGSKIILLASLLLLTVSGSAFADPSNLDVVRDNRGNPIRTEEGGCVRTRWHNDYDACAGEVQNFAEENHAAEPAKAHPVLAREDRTVYFAFNRAELTDEGRAKLDSLANVLKNDYDIKSVNIAGYADRIGSVKYNDRLSHRRADMVRDYLIAQGIANVRTTDTRWFGKDYPKTECSKDLQRGKLIACLAPDRRVEVEIEYGTPAAPQE